MPGGIWSGSGLYGYPNVGSGLGGNSLQDLVNRQQQFIDQAKVGQCFQERAERYAAEQVAEKAARSTKQKKLLLIGA